MGRKCGVCGDELKPVFTSVKCFRCEDRTKGKGSQATLSRDAAINILKADSGWHTFGSGSTVLVDGTPYAVVSFAHPVKFLTLSVPMGDQVPAEYVEYLGRCMGAM